MIIYLANILDKFPILLGFIENCQIKNKQKKVIGSHTPTHIALIVIKYSTSYIAFLCLDTHKTFLPL